MRFIVPRAARERRWTVPLLLTRTLAGGLRLEVTMEMQLRADVRPWRLHLREVTGGRDVVPIVLYNRRGPVARHVATGEISQVTNGITTTISWTGQGELRDVPGLSMLSLNGVLDWVSRTFSATLLAVGGQHEQREVRSLDGQVLSESTTMVPYGAEAPTTPDVPLKLAFDASWNVIAGSYPLPPGTRDLLGTRVLESVLIWPSVPAEFPPSETVGGN